MINDKDEIKRNYGSVIMVFLSRYKNEIGLTDDEESGVLSFYFNLVNDGFAINHSGGVNSVLTNKEISNIMIIKSKCKFYAYILDFYAYLNQNSIWLKQPDEKQILPDWLTLGSVVYDLSRGVGVVITVVELVKPNETTVIPIIIAEFNTRLSAEYLLWSLIKPFVNMEINARYGFYTIDGRQFTGLETSGRHMEATLFPGVFEAPIKEFLESLDKENAESHFKMNSKPDFDGDIANLSLDKVMTNRFPELHHKERQVCYTYTKKVKISREVLDIYLSTFLPEVSFSNGLIDVYEKVDVFTFANLIEIAKEYVVDNNITAQEAYDKVTATRSI